MLEASQIVRVLAPFNDALPGTHEITEVQVHADAQIVYILGENGGFAPEYVEVAE